MKKPKEDYSTRTIKTPDGLKITFFEINSIIGMDLL